MDTAPGRSVDSPDPLRVLAVLPALVSGAGAENSFVALLGPLAERGIAVTLVLLNQNAQPDKGGTLRSGVAASGSEVIDLTGRGRIRELFALRRLIATRPDIVHSALWRADGPTRIAGLGLGVPALCTWATTSYNEGRQQADDGVSRLKLSALRWLDRLTGTLSSSYFHAVTEGVAVQNGASLAVAPERIRVAERGRNAATFDLAPDERRQERRKVRSELGIDENDFMVLAVGRTAPTKNHLGLVVAAQRTDPKGRRLHLAIAGPAGAHNARLIEAAAAANAHGEHFTVHVLGERRDVPSLLAAADVLACASLYEGAAGAVIEAMLSGTPVVAYRLDGLDGVLRDGSNALVVPIGDSEALSAALGAVAADPEAAAVRASAAKAEALTRFSIDASAEALAATYRWVAAGGVDRFDGQEADGREADGREADALGATAEAPAVDLASDGVTSARERPSSARPTADVAAHRPGSGAR